MTHEIPREIWEQYRQHASIIPIRANSKQPLVDWKPYQERKAYSDEVFDWLHEWPDAQIGIVTGKISGCVVVDCDGEVPEDMPEGPRSSTGRGTHCWFQYQPIGNLVGIRLGVDVRGDGGYVLVPPSVHPNGEHYSWWDKDPFHSPLPTLPRWVLEASAPKWKQATNGAPQGQRNESAASMAGKILSSLDAALWDTAGWGGLLEWNKRNSPPLSERELRTTFESIASRERTKHLEDQDDFEPEIFCLADRMHLPIPETKWIVEGILPEGVAMLAGKPKYGKSFLALDMALAVASGRPLWNIEPTLAHIVEGNVTFKTTQGPVLYLALEDEEGRLRRRIQNLGIAKGEGNFHYSFEWPRLAKGGITKMRRFLEQHPDTKLIVLDVFQKVRSAKRGGRGELYQEDSEDIRPFKKLCRDYPIAFLIVHHAGKAEREDPMDLVSGTTGLTGAVDTVWVIAPVKAEKWAHLYCKGRDVEPLDIAIRQRLGGAWDLIDLDGEQYRASEQSKSVFDVLVKAGGPLKPADIAFAMGEATTNRVRQTLFRLVKAEKVIRTDDGRYQAR